MSSNAAFFAAAFEALKSGASRDVALNAENSAAAPNLDGIVAVGILCRTRYINWSRNGSAGTYASHQFFMPYSADLHWFPAKTKKNAPVDDDAATRARVALTTPQDISCVYRVQGGYMVFVKQMKDVKRLVPNGVYEIKGMRFALGTSKDKENKVFFDVVGGWFTEKKKMTTMEFVATLPWDVRSLVGTLVHPSHVEDLAAIMQNKPTDAEHDPAEYAPARGAVFAFNQSASASDFLEKTTGEGVFVSLNDYTGSATFVRPSADGKGQEMCVRHTMADGSTNDISARVLQRDAAGGVTMLLLMLSIYEEALLVLGMPDIPAWVRFGPTFLRGLAAESVVGRVSPKTARQDSVPDGCSAVLAMNVAVRIDMAATVRNIGYRIPTGDARRLLISTGTCNPTTDMITTKLFRNYTGLEQTGKPFVLERCIPAQGGQRCFPMGVVDGYAHALFDEGANVEFYLVCPHNHANTAKMTADEYVSGFAESDVLVYAITPRPFVDYLSPTKRVVPAVVPATPVPVPAAEHASSSSTTLPDKKRSKVTA